MMKVLLDTNVILDMAMERHPFYADAIAVFNKITVRNISAYISASIATDIVYILGKKAGKERALAFLRELIKTIDIVGVDKSSIINALALGWTDFEDAVQAQVAIENGMDVIITRNVRDFQKTKTLRIMTPQAFVAAE